MKLKTVLFSFIIILMFPVAAFSEKGANEVKEESFQFLINPIVGPEEISFELSLINSSNKILDFEFNTSQYYEITVTNEKGEIFYKFSEGKAFLQAIQHLALKPGETKKWIENVSVKIPPGKYRVDAELKTRTMNGEKVGPVTHQAFMVIPPENPIIKDLTVNQLNDIYHVYGKARPSNGKLYYVVEDGHHEWIKETKLQMGNKGWRKFSVKITLPKKSLKHSPLFLYIYGKDDNGRIIHPYPKILIR